MRYLGVVFRKLQIPETGISIHVKPKWKRAYLRKIFWVGGPHLSFPFTYLRTHWRANFHNCGLLRLPIESNTPESIGSHSVQGIHISSRYEGVASFFKQFYEMQRNPHCTLVLFIKERNNRHKKKSWLSVTNTSVEWDMNLNIFRRLAVVLERTVDWAVFKK